MKSFFHFWGVAVLKHELNDFYELDKLQVLWVAATEHIEDIFDLAFNLKLIDVVVPWDTLRRFGRLGLVAVNWFHKLWNFDSVFGRNFWQEMFGTSTCSLLRRQHILHNSVYNGIENIPILNSGDSVLLECVDSNRFEKHIQGRSQLSLHWDDHRVRWLGQYLE